MLYARSAMEGDVLRSGVVLKLMMMLCCELGWNGLLSHLLISWFSLSHDHHLYFIFSPIQLGHMFSSLTEDALSQKFTYQWSIKCSLIFSSHVITWWTGFCSLIAGYILTVCYLAGNYCSLLMTQQCLINRKCWVSPWFPFLLPFFQIFFLKKIIILLKCFTLQ